MQNTDVPTHEKHGCADEWKTYVLTNEVKDEPTHKKVDVLTN